MITPRANAAKAKIFSYQVEADLKVNLCLDQPRQFHIPKELFWTKFIF